MIIICKIFYMCNSMRILPMLLEPGKLSNWIDIIVTILNTRQDPNSQLEQLTDDMNVIEQLDKHEWWKLKGICCKISIKLY